VAIYKYDNLTPEIGNNSYISDSARIIGDVIIGEDCYIGHGAILRGDYGKIIIGNGTAVEENAVLHIRPEGILELKKSVTIGHGALIHCKLIKTFAVIGIGAVVGFDAVIGKWSIVAEGCVVTKRAVIPDEKIVTGVPYKITGNTKPEHKKFWQYGKQLYVDLAHEYPKKFRRID
jgi:carbonic anhydrase/acetyltransferase-like protein (isoleucine patch superfamily)